MKKYRKKPVVVEAVQWQGPVGDAGVSVDELKAWGVAVEPAGNWGRNDVYSLLIPTLEGVHRCDVGDWIIRGVKGEFYPCKPDIFAATYEEA